ncbi:MAG: LPS export ABC transporter periplasmic protein LptC [Candidatus Endonucleobacter bathymodioli]|uniref:LPS export ABC transporter periplasmic protein LptC n=1 Tax=Candidatus Endonucleibacter bathymodioli TaxID=539814 RepID=A0AA90NXN0_9GAMM|nr:LPS export ABC transporter periplasmic protein LptC [Candidatus Endonucleobacter bathymodioli]
MLKRNYPVIAGLFFMILSIGYWAYYINLYSSTEQKSEVSQQDADYFMEEANTLKYNDKGELEYKTFAKQISHYPYNDTILLSLPHMTSYGTPAKISEVGAINGKLLPGNEILILWGEVIITQNMIGTGENVVLDTEYLTLDLVKNTAKTDRNILITSKHGSIRATGMEVFYEEGLINFKSRVRGLYVPE